MSKTDNNFVLKNEESSIDICRDCGVEKTLYISDGKLICNLCGEETTILADSDKPIKILEKFHILRQAH